MFVFEKHGNVIRKMDDYENDIFMVDMKEKYLTVIKLLNEDSQHDPAFQPFKSKYAAMNILKTMESTLMDSSISTHSKESTINPILAVIYLNLGLISIEVDELKESEDYLMRAIIVLEKITSKSDKILLLLSTFNQLGILWSKRNQMEKAIEYLEKSEKLFKDFNDQNDFYHPPKNISTFFYIEDFNEPTATEIVNKLHTLTLYYLAQMYGNVNNFDKSAIYCFMTLERQLELNDYDHIDWALNAATLSQFFMEKSRFHQARHLLSAASHVLKKYENQLKNSQPETDDEIQILDSKWENFRHRNADIARCWAKYGLILMIFSRDRLISDEEKTTDSSCLKFDSTSHINLQCLDNLEFNTFKKILETKSKVTDKYLLDFTDAKEIFLNIQKWLEEAALYYTLQDQASDYIQIVQDMSQAYKYLSFFEEDETRQSKMHKRRIGLLEKVLKELNEKYYEASCQQIWIELAETYAEILDIKMERLKKLSKRQPPQVLRKINNLIDASIKYYTKFINSLKCSKSDRFSEDMMRPALCAYFNLGRLYNKFIVIDKKLQLKYIKKSFEAYAYVVNYCEKNEKAENIMKIEISICKEFIELLPRKMKKIVQELDE